MAKFSLVTLILFVTVVNASTGSKLWWKMRDIAERYKRDKIKENYRREHLQPSGSAYPTMYLTQPMDHFDPQVTTTFTQRYWVNKDYWKNPDGPVFLVIGGEGRSDNSTVMAGEHVELAQKYGALIFSVEHRFYGGSINENGLELDQLQYLSSQQALADLAAFQGYANGKYMLGDKNKWICFGDSYAGALSAWYRIKYPHLVYAAVASSGVVKAELNYHGFADIAAHSLADPLAKGSTQCSGAIKEAFVTVDEMIGQGKNADLAKDFQTCTDLSNSVDIYQFVMSLGLPIANAVQVNGEVPGFYSVDSVCQVMASNVGTPYSRLQTLMKKMSSHINGKPSCLDSSWSERIAFVKNTTINTEEYVGRRQWVYQTCTEVGDFFTCDKGSECIFSHYMDLEYSLQTCLQVFGLTPETVMKRPNFTNEYYGGDHPKGSRIIFVNGSIDPWHGLSVLANTTSSQIAIFINGTSHIANSLPSKPTDPPQLVEARKQVSDIIGGWLSEDSD